MRSDPDHQRAGTNDDPLDLVVDLLGSPSEEVWPATPEPAPTDLGDLELADPSVQLEEPGAEPTGSLTDLDTTDLLPGPKLDSTWPQDDDFQASAPLELDPPSALQTGPGDDWPAEPTEPTDLDIEEISQERDDDWDPAADEMHMLPPGLRRIGFEEHVRMTALAQRPLHALCDASVAHSVLYLAWRPIEGGHIEVTLDEHSHELVVAEHTEDGTPIVDLPLAIGDHTCSVRFRLENQPAPIPVRLGRDVLAGAFVVDPAERFVLDP